MSISSKSYCKAFLSFFCIFISHPLNLEASAQFAFYRENDTIELEQNNCQYHYKTNRVKLFSNTVVEPYESCAFKTTLASKEQKYHLEFQLIKGIFDQKEGKTAINIFSETSPPISVKMDGMYGMSEMTMATLLPLMSSQSPTLVVMKTHVGNGPNNCATEPLIFIDRNFSDNYFQVTRENILGYTNARLKKIFSEHRSNKSSLTTCFDIEDIDKDGVSEFLLRDARFSYRFSSGAASSFPTHILRLTPSGLRNVTDQHQSYSRKQAQELWSDLLSHISFSEKQNSAPDYFGNIAAYLATKSLLGEYKEAKQLAEQRISIDRKRFPNLRKTSVSEIETFLIQSGYVR